jgi:hypothetical protein
MAWGRVSQVTEWFDASAFFVAWAGCTRNCNEWIDLSLFPTDYAWGHSS